MEDSFLKKYWTTRQSRRKKYYLTLLLAPFANKLVNNSGHSESFFKNVLFYGNTRPPNMQSLHILCMDYFGLLI